MTDDDLLDRLSEINRSGQDGIPAMRELLRAEGGMSRLVGIIEQLRAKASRPKRQKKPRGLRAMSPLPAEFPFAEDRERAVSYWRGRGRGDLPARIEEMVAEFRAHHGPPRATKALSWPVTWQTWYVNAVKFTKPPAGSLAPVLALEETTAVWIQRLEVYHGFHDGSPVGTWPERWRARPGNPACEVPKEAWDAFFRTHPEKQAK